MSNGFDYAEPTDIREYFEFERSIKVLALSVKWDLYWGSYPLAVLRQANSALNRAARFAIQKKDPTIFHQMQEKYAEYGAYDSEPSWQFEWLWNQAYGYTNEY